MAQHPPKNWNTVSPSRFPWEQEALDFIHEKFPASPEYLAWTNFEFIAPDGSINESDLLIASPWGVFLVEIKSRPGRLSGDGGAWTWVAEDGRRRTDDNPLLLTNRKSKRLKDLLGRQPAFRGREVPFIQPLVFCSAPDLVLQLSPDARNFVCVRDSADGSRPGIRAAIFRRQCPGLRPSTDRLVDGPTLRALAQGMAQAGLRGQHRKVADFVLDRLRYESPTGVFQDWDAHHSSSESVRRLVRLYLSATQSAKEDRVAIAEAAKREFHTLERLSHPGILKALVPAESELGPAIIFEFDPTAQRLDHYIAENGAQLDVSARFYLLRQVADAIRYAHDKNVVHRSLSPQSIFVLRNKKGETRVQLYNWQTVGRLTDGSFSGLTGLTVTTHAWRMLEDPARAFLAPETLTPHEEPAKAMDVFSLGALAYFLFGNQPPALDAAELLEKLKASSSHSLELREVSDGISERIATLVRESTRASIVERCSLEEFLGYLDEILDELTRPENEVADPHDAQEGSVLSNGFKVERILGRGSSAKAQLVTKGDLRCVLKVARDATFNRRLDLEFQTLKKLGSPNIVKVFERYELNGLTAFTVELAGERTLARMLKEDGPPDLELLQRYGEELISAVDYLDKEGVFHRDIKPENIGIGDSGGARPQKRLRLFDFSLVGAAPTDLRVGTLEYIDPFLEDRKARRYDLSAELYAVALTLHELATGERPKWKDGQPRVTKEEISLSTDRFDPDLRDHFTGFFRTALHRDYRKRYDNTREMLRAWGAIFETIDRPTSQTDHDQPKEEIVSEAMLTHATPATQLVLLGLNTRLMNVLDRLGLHTVTDLLQFKFGRFEKFRGVGRKTQKDVITLMHRLRARFPDVEAGQLSAPALPAAPTASVTGQETVDVLAHHALLVKSGKAGETEASVLHPFLGLSSTAKPERIVWLSQTDLATVCYVTRQRIGQIVTTARGRWAKSAPLGGLRDAILEVLFTKGGVMTHQELIAFVLTARGSLSEEPLRSQLASAAVRAAVEAEHMSREPRFEDYRSGDKIFVALHPELRTYALNLGSEADRLALLDPLPTSTRVLEELRAVKFPDVVPHLIAPVEARLRQLAVASSTQADLSSRGEIYPLGLPAVRALALARNAMFGDELTVTEIERRLRARFPKCGQLPQPPELHDVLRKAGFDWKWDPLAANNDGAYRPTHNETTSPSNTLGSRRPTHLTAMPGRATDPEIVQALAVENRLRHSAAEGGYLILSVEPSRVEEACRELINRFSPEVCDLDELFLDALRDEAGRLGASWDVVLAADSSARDSGEWGNLQILVERALPAVEQRLRSVRKTCLAINPGLLARYGHMNLISSLASDIGRAGGPGGLWVLVPANGQHPLPTINGVPIPITNANQDTHLTSAWLRNEHRASLV